MQTGKATRKRCLIVVISDSFDVCESVKSLLANWNDVSSHAVFIEEMWKFQTLRRELSGLGYNDSFVDDLVKAIYGCVFRQS